jgi:nicotinamide mononucleotide transporter
MLDTVVKWMELTSPWELAAVVLALAYLLLAVRRSLWCWPCGFVSSAIYVVLTYDKRLYMQAALNVFYVAMAVYGYIEWRKRQDSKGEVPVVRWTTSMHVAAAVGVSAVTIVNGWRLEAQTDAVSPYLDAFVTWGSVLTTWMVARRVVENWLYWIIVDGVAVVLYFRQDLRVTALLFVAYIGIVIHGYRVWVRESKRSCTLAADT